MDEWDVIIACIYYLLTESIHLLEELFCLANSPSASSLFIEFFIKYLSFNILLVVPFYLLSSVPRLALAFTHFCLTNYFYYYYFY